MMNIGAEGIARALYIKQLSKAQLEKLQKKEIKRGWTYPPFLFRNLFFPETIIKTGPLTEKEITSVEDDINKIKPRIKDNDGDYYTDLEFTHAWDWNIFHLFPGIFEVGKLRKRANKLIEEVG